MPAHANALAEQFIRFIVHLLLGTMLFTFLQYNCIVIALLLSERTQYFVEAPQVLWIEVGYLIAAVGIGTWQRHRLPSRTELIRATGLMAIIIGGLLSLRLI